MTDDLDDLLSRIDALDTEGVEPLPPPDQWDDLSPDDEERMAFLDDPEPLEHPPREEFDLTYAMAVLRGLVRPHRELTDAEEIAGRRALAEGQEPLIVMPTYRSYSTADAMEVRESQGRLGYRWL